MPARPTRSIKKSVDKDDCRRRREDSSISIRKNKREEGLAKRRGAQINNLTGGALAAAEEEVKVTTPGMEPKRKTYTVEDLPALMAGLSSDNQQTQFEAVRGYRKVLSIEPNPPVHAVLEQGVMPAFIYYLQQTDRPQIQFEAAWALTNIASTDMTEEVVKGGALPIMVQLLMSENPDVREQCGWCLGNIAGDGAPLRKACLDAGALQGVLQNIMQPANESMLRNMVWTLSNFCRGKPQPALDEVRAAIPVLAQCIMSNDSDVLTDTCWALSYLSDGDNNRINAVACNQPMVVRLVELLTHKEAKVITPALRTIGNIVTGDTEPTQACIDAGCLHNVTPLLEHPKKGIRKEACWTLSNIAAGTRKQITQLMEQPTLLNKVLEHLDGAEWDVRKEAAWVISNIFTGGDHEQVYTLVNDYDTVKPVCELLGVHDAKIVLMALDALENMLKVGAGNEFPIDVAVMVDECDGIEALENLQQHENENIYDKAVQLIETYFGAEDDEEGENVAPQSNGNTFSFGAPAPAGKTFGDLGALGDAAAATSASAIIPAPQPFSFNANSFNFNAAH